MFNKKRAETRKWLNSYRWLKKEVQAREKHLEDFIRDMYNPLKATCIDDMPKGSGDTSDQTADMVIRINATMQITYVSMMNEMQYRIDNLKIAINEIEKVIESLPADERCILYHRFIVGIHWKNISEYLSYEQAQCTRIECRALDKLKR